MSMIDLSFTRFINFTSLDPHKRAQYVRELKLDSDYHFGKDYYGPLRSGVVSFHKKNHSLSHLDEIVEKAKESRRMNYQFVIDRYKDFLTKNRKLEWFDPIDKPFIYGDIRINVNPELGLIIKGKPTLIKMFFTEDGLTKKLGSGKAQLVFRVMDLALSDYLDDEQISILNMKSGKMVKRSKKQDELLDLNLETHLESFLYLWQNV